MPNWKKLIVSGSDATLNKLNVITSVTGSNLSVTDTATYNSVEFTNSNIMKFNQRYTGGANGSYFSNGEYQKVVTITPSAASQNYQVVGRMTAQNAGETHTVYFNAALRSNTLPDLAFTTNYEEEYNGGRYLDPQLWVKETATAGFIIAFKTLATIYGSVTIDFDVIPRAASQKANVTINQVTNSEQTSIDSGFTAYDMQRNLRNQNGNFTISGSVTADSFVGDGSGLTGITAEGTLSSSAQIASDISGSFTATSASIASDIASLVSFSSSLETTIYDYTGSFTGDGSGLTGISSDVSETATLADTFSNQTSVVTSHNFGTKNVQVTVYDNNDAMIIPDSIVTTDTNTITTTFDSSTSGRVVVGKAGHIVSGSTQTYRESISGASSYAVTHSLSEDYPIVQVYSSSRAQVIPSEIITTSANALDISFTSIFNGTVVVKK